MSQAQSIVPIGDNGDIVVPRPDKLHLQSRDDGPNAMIFDRPMYEQAYMAAQLFAKSDLVPGHFKGKPENCFIALQLAMRFKMDAFMVMQGCYIVHGRPGFEGKFIIALINASGQFQDPLDYDFEGVMGSDDWRVVVSAKRAKTGKLCSMTFRYSTAKAEGWVSGNPKWRNMPEQMMMYRGAAFFARVFCPEVIMGMQTSDEIEDIEPAPSRPTVVEKLAPKPGASRAESLAAKIANQNTPERGSLVEGNPAEPETTKTDPTKSPAEAGSGAVQAAAKIDELRGMKATSPEEAAEFAAGLLGTPEPSNKPQTTRRK